MGSGGSRALWPANSKYDLNSLLINLSFSDSIASYGGLNRTDNVFGNRLNPKDLTKPITNKFKAYLVFPFMVRGCSLGRYDDGLQKSTMCGEWESMRKERR